MITIENILKQSKDIRLNNNKNVVNNDIFKMFNEINFLIEVMSLQHFFSALNNYKKEYNEDFNLIYNFLIDIFISKNSVYYFNDELLSKQVFYYCGRNHVLCNNHFFNYNLIINDDNIKSKKNEYFKYYNIPLLDLIYKESFQFGKALVDNQLFNRNIFVTIHKLCINRKLKNIFSYKNLITISLLDNEFENSLTKNELDNILKNDYLSVLNKLSGETE